MWYPSESQGIQRAYQGRDDVRSGLEVLPLAEASRHSGVMEND